MDMAKTRLQATENHANLDLVGIQYQLEDLVGCKVDLIEKRSVVDSHNYIRRNNILNTAKVIYESRFSLASDTNQYS